MTMRVQKFEKLEPALKYLEALSSRTQIVVFRGHQSSKWRLQTTLNRFKRTYSHQDNGYNHEIGGILEQFKGALTRLGKLPFFDNSRADWLEYAQHHGVPTPLLDFTYSPYIAVFFAINGIRPRYRIKGQRHQYFAIYALDISQLAHVWARYLHLPEGKWNSEKYTIIDATFHEFVNPGDDLFQNGFPANRLIFVPRSGAENYRMSRQMGVFLYDSIDYAPLGFQDLEDFIARAQEPSVLESSEIRNGDPTMTKILINEQCVSEAFARLEMMGISATTLFGDSNGAAMDVRNAYYYNPKTLLIRDRRIWDIGK